MLKTYNVNLSKAGHKHTMNFAIEARNLADLCAKVRAMGMSLNRVESVEI